MAAYVLITMSGACLAKAMGEALSEVLPGNTDPGIRETPSSGSR
jgi:hypothetical protein